MAPENSAVAHVFGTIAAAAVRGRILVVALWLALAAGSVWLAAATLGINTDTTDMLSPELEFRKQFTAYRTEFPHGKGSLVVVVKGPTSDLADAAARQLTVILRRGTSTFRTVFFPQGSRFFRRNGLLYLNLGRLESLSDRLTEAQPVLGLFVRKPNVVGLFGALETVLKNVGGSKIPADRLASLLDRVSAALEAASKGESKPVDWSAVIGGFQSDRTAVIVTQPVLNFASLSPAKAAMQRVRAIAVTQGLTADRGYSVRLTGSAAISSEEISSVTVGASQAGLLSLGLVVVLLLIGMRQPWSILAVVLTLVTGLAVTLGFVAIAIGQLNLISVAFAVLFIGLGVDFGIHYALRVAEFARDEARFTAAARSVGPALALAAASAALSFLAFLFTDYRGVAELGLIAAVGMALALVSCLTLLPAIQSFRTIRPVPGLAAGTGPSTGQNKAIAVTAVVLGLGAAAAAPFVVFDRNPLNLKDPSADSVRTAISLVNHPRYGLTPIQIVAPTREAAASLATRLTKLPEVRSVRTINSFLPGDQEDKREIIDELALLLKPMFATHPIFATRAIFRDQATTGRPKSPVPEANEFAKAALSLRKAAVGAARTVKQARLRQSASRLAAVLLPLTKTAPDARGLVRLNADIAGGLVLRLHSLAESLNPGAVTLAALPADLRSRYVSRSGAYKVEVLPRKNLQDNRALKAFVAAVQKVAPTATGSPVVELRAGNAVIEAFLLATALAAGIILVLLFLVLRRALDVLLVIGPVALAGLLTVGTVVLFDRSFNFANIIALPLLIGLGAAGGIHIVSRWRQAGPDDSASTTPRAILFSALTTVASFGTLAVSPHRGTASMGELLMIAIGWSLVCTLVVLPAVLRLISGRKAHG